ncbi:MAG: hypothetical protein ACK4N6_01485 [Rhodocyclaceae bacterium]
MSLTHFAAMLALLGAIWAVPAVSMESQGQPQRSESGAAAALDSSDLERRLQRLSWAQFKRVVEAVPKLKASVDAYGPLGWQYVQANYSTYHWKKNVDRLDAAQRGRDSPS